MAESAVLFILELVKDPIINTFRFLKRHISYPFDYDSKVQKLEAETRTLKNQRDRLQQSVDEAKRKGEEIYDNVTKWLISSALAIEEAEELILGKDEAKQKRCFIGFGPDLNTRYQRSRKADKKALAFREICNNGNLYPVSYRPKPKQSIPPSVYDHEVLGSRVSLLKDVVDALQDPNHNMIGVYGMGGVGKTTLAKEVHRQVQTEKLFEVVVFVVISMSPEITIIQKEIAEVLGLPLIEDGLLARAGRLCESLRKEESVLIILDDVWNQLKLEQIGIPFGDDCKGCKILLTSRRLDVCREMDAKKKFSIEALSNDEAWSLFQKTVVGDAKDKKLPPIATEVARKCCGLPLLILVVATDLQKRGSWEDMLKQLSEFDDEDMETKVQSVLKKSYDSLPTKELKQFFLLCGLFGQANILMEDLLRYSMGLGLLRHVDTVREARNKAGRMIDYLKAECLLLEGDMDEHVKMHDIVRYTARSIASKEHNVFIGLSGSKVRKWPDKDCTRISLPYCDILALPKQFDCPRAGFLQILTEDFSLEIPESFFEGIIELNVLDLYGMCLERLPLSLGLLANLHTLCLDGFSLDDISIVGQLKQLEVLSLRNSTIVELPREIEQLTQLKLLDLNHCCNLSVIPANVLSKLLMLEELYMWNYFQDWDSEGNVSLAELERLPRLETLETRIQHVKVFPNLRLKKYKLVIENRCRDTWKQPKTSKYLKLELKENILSEQGIEVLLREAEEVHLKGDENSENMVKSSVLNELAEFQQLKNLEVESNGVLENLITLTESQLAFPNLETLSLRNLTMLKSICECSLATGSLNNLRVLQVFSCGGKTTSLFSFSSAKFLAQLQVLEVVGCESLEYIFGGESEDSEDMMEFSQLTSLKLKHLENFKSFCRRQPNDTSLPLFDGKVSFPKLSNLTIGDCSKLMRIFTVPSLKTFLLLSNLTIDNCKLMEEIIVSEQFEKDENGITFPTLELLELKSLRELKSLCSGYSVQFKTLKQLRISECGKMTSFVSDNRTQSLFNEMVTLSNLEEIFLSSMDGFKYIWFDEFIVDGSFSKLNTLKIERCRNLLTIFPLNTARRFQKLESLEIDGCLSLVEIYEIPQHFTNKEIENEAMVFELRKLKIKYLPLLKSIWNENSKYNFIFQNLVSVKVSSCNVLRNIFPVSIVKNLFKLEELKAEFCGGMKEIIAKAKCDEEEGIIHFEFPQLFSVELNYLEKLTNFYPGKHISSWPKLKYVDVYNCSKAVKFSLKFDEHQEIHGQYEDDFPNIQPLFLVEKGKISDSIEEVTLDGYDLKQIENGRLPTDWISKFKVVTLISLDEEGLHSLNRLVSLHKLFINGESIRVLFSLHEGKQQLPPRVKHLELSEIDNLEHIWEYDDENGSKIQPLLHCLESLKLESCHSLIKIAPSSSTFRNLSTLKVIDCGNLRNLVTASTAKTMHNLTTIQLEVCKEMTEIVGNDDANGDDTKDEEISFNKLKSLILWQLNSVTSFCSTSHQLNFPSLEHVEINGCLKMKVFCSGSLSTPNIRSIEIGWKRAKERDINLAIENGPQYSEEEATSEEEVEEATSEEEEEEEEEEDATSEEEEDDDDDVDDVDDHDADDVDDEATTEEGEEKSITYSSYAVDDGAEKTGEVACPGA